jgi:superfamily II DNA or RNA helicase
MKVLDTGADTAVDSNTRLSGAAFTPTPKTDDKLREQLSALESTLNVSLIPHATTERTQPLLNDLSVKELREFHATRYHAMVTILPYIKRGEPVPEAIKERFAHQIRLLNNLETYTAGHREGKDGRLREPQVDVMEDISCALGNGELQGYVKLPTGFGKTRIFAALTEAMDVKTLVLVPKSLLCSQTVREFKKLSPTMDVHERHGGKDTGDGKVVISTYQYFVEASKDGRLDPTQFGAVILDEGHKALGDKTQEAIARIPAEVPTIAFTATPTYNDRKSLEAIIGECWHEVALSSAIRMGALAPVSVVLAKTKVDLSSVSMVGENYDEREFTRAVQQAGLSQSAVQLYTQAFADRSAVGFCASVAHAEECAQEFQKAGITAAALSGQTPEAVRDQVIEDFRAGTIKALFSADLLIEGFDAANASVCLNMAPTASIVSAEQRGGRVLRLDPKDPSKLAVVVDFFYPDERRAIPQVFFTDILGGINCPTGSENSPEGNKAQKDLRERLSALEMDGLRLVVEADEVLKVLQDSRPIQELMPAPDGWLTVKQIAERLRKTDSMIRSLLKELGADAEGLKGRFIPTPGARASFMYDPEIIPKIEESRATRSVLRPGWHSVSSLAHQLGREYAAIERQLETLIKDKPELVDRIRLKNSWRSIFHPSVLDMLREDTSLDFRKWPRFTLDNITTEFKLPRALIQKVVDRVCEENPDLWRRDPGQKKSALFIKDGFLDKVREQVAPYLGSYTNAEGQLTVQSLAAYQGLDAQQIVDIRNTLVPPGTPPWTTESILKGTMEHVCSLLLPHAPAPDRWLPSLPYCVGGFIPDIIARSVPAYLIQKFRVPGQTGKSEYLHPRLIEILDAAGIKPNARVAQTVYKNAFANRR